MLNYYLQVNINEMHLFIDVEHCLAWAFLKPIGVNGMNNTHNKLQLQLYKPKTDVRETEGIHVFDWWSSTRRKK